MAIGNGTACRETEEFFAEMFGAELKDQGVAYVIVNEAGASVYSTSQLGREEFPEYDATLRGAVSIGRRLQDPLSELVKIEPANIGVGLYQHDVKAKHLRGLAGRSRRVVRELRGRGRRTRPAPRLLALRVRA